MYADKNKEPDMPIGRSGRFFTLKVLIRIAFTVLSLGGAAHAQSGSAMEPRPSGGNCNFMAAAADPLGLGLREGRQSRGQSFRGFGLSGTGNFRLPDTTLSAVTPFTLRWQQLGYETKPQPLSLL
jgi:hypothetical protein